MARITVEDCLDHVENRFELVMISSKRARQLSVGGKEPRVPRENDKPTVIALREIEEGFVDVSILSERDPSEELMELEMMQEEKVESASQPEAEPPETPDSES